MKRSVERIEGVRQFEFDLNTGHGAVLFEPGRSVSSATLWKAVQQGGFTPVRVESGGEVYSGPKV